METPIITLLTIISLGVLLCAFAITFKVIRECIKHKELANTILCAFMILIQYIGIIIIIKSFIHYILN